MSKMMPGEHLLTLVSVVDEALEEHIASKDIPWPAKTKRDFFNRISVLGVHLQDLDTSGLHELRDARNRVAHGTEVDGHRSVTWLDLDAAIDLAMKTFSVLGLHERTPLIEAYFERVPTLNADALGPNGERMRQSHRVGAKIDDQVLLEYGIDVSYFPPTDA